MFWVAFGRVQLSIKLRLNSTEKDVKWSGPSNTTISDLKAFIQVRHARPLDARCARAHLTPCAVAPRRRALVAQAGAPRAAFARASHVGPPARLLQSIEPIVRLCPRQLQASNQGSRTLRIMHASRCRERRARARARRKNE